LEFSAIFHQVSVWLFRVAIVGGIAGAVYLYMNKADVAPGAPVTAQAGVPAPAGDVAPCQPLGHTASGKLVYSMDCEGVPAPDAAGR